MYTLLPLKPCSTYLMYTLTLQPCPTCPIYTFLTPKPFPTYPIYTFLALYPIPHIHIHFLKPIALSHLFHIHALNPIALPHLSYIPYAQIPTQCAYVQPYSPVTPTLIHIGGTWINNPTALSLHNLSIPPRPYSPIPHIPFMDITLQT